MNNLLMLMSFNFDPLAVGVLHCWISVLSLLVCCFYFYFFPMHLKKRKRDGSPGISDVAEELQQRSSDRVIQSSIQTFFHSFIFIMIPNHKHKNGLGLGPGRTIYSVHTYLN